MKTFSKFVGGIFAAITLIGIIVFVVAMSAVGWDFNKLTTTKVVDEVYEVTDSFDNISIKADTEDIKILLSENDECRVECKTEGYAPIVEVKDGVLLVNEAHARKWYEYINIGSADTYLAVYLPKSVYGLLNINTSTGDVEVSNDLCFTSIDIHVSTADVECGASATGDVKITAGTGDICIKDVAAGSLELLVSTGSIKATNVTCIGELKLYVSTGKSYLSRVACKSLTSDGDTGDLNLISVIANEKIYVVRSTGDVLFDGCDAEELYIETDTGDVEGSLLSEKVFIIETSTGDVEVPKTTSGGRCEIITSTGDIEISIKK